MNARVDCSANQDLFFKHVKYFLSCARKYCIIDYNELESSKMKAVTLSNRILVIFCMIEALNLELTRINASEKVQQAGLESVGRNLVKDGASSQLYSIETQTSVRSTALPNYVEDIPLDKQGIQILRPSTTERERNFIPHISNSAGTGEQIVPTAADASLRMPTQYASYSERRFFEEAAPSGISLPPRAPTKRLERTPELKEGSHIRSGATSELIRRVKIYDKAIMEGEDRYPTLDEGKMDDEKQQYRSSTDPYARDYPKKLSSSSTAEMQSKRGEDTNVMFPHLMPRTLKTGVGKQQYRRYEIPYPLYDGLEKLSISYTGPHGLYDYPKKIPTHEMEDLQSYGGTMAQTGVDQEEHNRIRKKITNKTGGEEQSQREEHTKRGILKFPDVAPQ